MLAAVPDAAAVLAATARQNRARLAVDFAPAPTAMALLELELALAPGTADVPPDEEGWLACAARDGTRPEKAPVLAASATPPVPMTATSADATSTFAVRNLRSGDLIICSLREVVTGRR